MSSRPGVGDAAFQPRADGMLAQWGITSRRFDGVFQTVEVLQLDDVEANGRPVRWMASGFGDGVRFARVISPWGVPLAIVRAVPLS